MPGHEVSVNLYELMSVEELCDCLTTEKKAARFRNVPHIGLQDWQIQTQNE